ncbi:MAG: PPOX class F420-dependent oxidoreductase [Clostridiaceae bacterium]
MEQSIRSTEAFANAKYLNIETYRRSGESIRTPVWFVESGGLLFFLTRADSGKAKRLRHNIAVKVAPCKMNGDVSGDWQPGEATFVETEESAAAIKSLFEQKYGAVLRISVALSKLQKKKRVFVKVNLQT